VRGGGNLWASHRVVLRSLQAGKPASGPDDALRARGAGRGDLLLKSGILPAVQPLQSSMRVRLSHQTLIRPILQP